MRAIMLMFDTLTRNYLPNYGCELANMPNFKRLQERTVTFDEFYAGSMPCMPARRELHTGKYNFLHRGWGPLEPFDISCIERMKQNGIYTHLCTDHSHYFEDGGGTYHNRYKTYEAFRGQEGDRWTPQKLADLSLNTCSKNKHNESAVQHLANRSRIVNEEDMPSVKTVSAGIDFISHYVNEDNWFLQVECFDPHEPFYVPEKYRQIVGCGDSHQAFNFPPYCSVGEQYSKEDIQNLRKEYLALLLMCDAQVGRVLDTMDELDMWKDTLLIVNTDHGFFLGEHDYIGKNFPPMYDEVSHLPFFIHDPRNASVDGQRRKSLAQTVDIAPTLLSYFELEPLQNIDGKDLKETIQHDEKIRDSVLYGVHGSQINLYDGRYTYMKSSVDQNAPLYDMTLMTTTMRGFLSLEGINQATLVDGGNYSNGCQVLQIPLKSMYSKLNYPTMIFDKSSDSLQQHPIVDEKLQKVLDQELQKAMEEAHAPSWQFERMGYKPNN